MIRLVVCSVFCLFLAGVSASADQYDPRLDELFARLAAAPAPDDARPIGVAIRDIWRIYDGNSYDVVEFLNRGSRAALRGEGHLAELAFGGVIQRAPNFVEGWHQRGRLRLGTGDVDSAIADLRFALSLEPRHFDALAALGLCHLALGQPKDALAAFQAALRIHPYLPVALEQVAELRRALRDPI